MNKIFIILVLIFLISPELFAVIRPADPPPNSVGVPLDGGLLTILAGAGIAYFAARKRKKSSQA